MAYQLYKVNIDKIKEKDFIFHLDDDKIYKVLKIKTKRDNFNPTKTIYTFKCLNQNREEVKIYMSTFSEQEITQVFRVIELNTENIRFLDSFEEFNPGI